MLSILDPSHKEHMTVDLRVGFATAAACVACTSVGVCKYMGTLSVLMSAYPALVYRTIVCRIEDGCPLKEHLPPSLGKRSLVKLQPDTLKNNRVNAPIHLTANNAPLFVLF